MDHPQRLLQLPEILHAERPGPEGDSAIARNIDAEASVGEKHARRTQDRLAAADLGIIDQIDWPVPCHPRHHPRGVPQRSNVRKATSASGVYRNGAAGCAANAPPANSRPRIHPPTFLRLQPTP